MPITPDRLTKLRDFGLSEYAARAYLALLDLGTSEARDISSISKVPQAKIYHVLEQLHEKGLVVILPEFPKKYVPVPFEDYINRVYEEHTKAAEQIESEREELAEMFAVVGDTDVGNRGFFTVIRGRRNVLSKIDEMIEGTKRELIVLGTAGTALRAGGLIPQLPRAKERGVRIRMLAPLDAETLPKLERLAQFAEIRARDLDEEAQSRKVAIAISDGARAFLIHFVPDDSNLYAGKDIGVFTDQEAMVAAIQAIVEPHWGRAPDIGAKRAEVLEGRAPPFARIYTSSEDARSAFDRAMAAGVRDVSGVVAYPDQTADEIAPVVQATAKGGATLRVLLNVPTVGAADALMDLVATTSGTEVRHSAPRLIARQWILDEREAFFSVLGKDAAGELVVHTNAAPVIASMRRHFDALWQGALPLETRRHELDLFPALQPGDLGLGSLFNQIQDAVIVADEAGDVVLWNPSATRLFGKQPQEAMGTPLIALADDRHAEPFGRALARVREARLGSPEARHVVETACRRADGSAVEVEWVVSRVFDPTMRGRLVLAIGRDITDSKRAREGEVRTTMQVIRVYERMAEAFYALDRDWRFVYRNPATKKMQRSLSDEQIDGKVIWEVFPDLRGTKFDLEFRRAMRDMQPVHFEEEYGRLGASFEVSAYPSPDGLSVYFRDITTRKRADAANEERFRAAFATSPTPMAVVRSDGRISEANAALSQLLGTEPKALVESPADRLGASAKELHAAFEDLRSGGAARGLDVRVGERAMRLTLTPIRRADGELVEAVAHLSDAVALPVHDRDADKPARTVG